MEKWLGWENWELENRELKINWCMKNTVCVKTRCIYKEIYLILDFRSEWIVTYLIFFSKLQNFIP